ncbi:MAG TPA: transcription termination factor NusA, partial [Myxococcota bacterium]|nr:transcription termination factor NusA [Myxococcota bacterium]
EEAMKQAARREHGQETEIEARFNEELGEVELFEFREVVEAVTDPLRQITIGDAAAYDPGAELGDEIGVKIDTSKFGRILAQTAKQVIIQRIREAERDTVYEEYKDRQGEIVNGIVRRFEKGAIIVDLGRAEAVLPPKEQVPRENYRPNDRVRAYVLEVNKNVKGSQIVLSRACIEMLTKLFEQEVPEIYEGIVTIKSAAREPGGRSKIAVASRDGDVDPVGACVGMRGSRVQAVVQELRGEKIDIVPWSADPVRYVVAALAPAQVVRIMVDDEKRSMDVIVPDDQQSLAIGKKGQNVRLAVMLTRWKIDIKSEMAMRAVQAELAQALSAVEGAGDYEAKILLDHGVASLDELAEAEVELLTQIPGITEAGAQSVKARARELAIEKAKREREAAAAAPSQGGTS